MSPRLGSFFGHFLVILVRQPHAKLTMPRDNSSIWHAQTAQDYLLSRKYTRDMIPGSSHVSAAATVYANFPQGGGELGFSDWEDWIFCITVVRATVQTH